MASKTLNAHVDSLPINTLRTRWKSILDIYSCPICLEGIRPDPIQCVNEHLLCRECKRDLNKCPTCRQSFSIVKPPRSVTQVIELLPRVCKHNNCDTILEPRSDHEVYCGFKIHKCNICEWHGPGKDTLNHVKEAHPNYSLFTNECNTVISKRFDHLKKRKTFTPFVVQDYFFWVETINNPKDKKHTKTCILVSNGKPTDDIFFQVFLTSTSSEFSCKIKLNPNPGFDRAEENKIDIPWHMLPDFIDNDSTLWHKVHFIFNKK